MMSFCTEGCEASGCHTGVPSPCRKMTQCERDINIVLSSVTQTLAK